MNPHKKIKIGIDVDEVVLEFAKAYLKHVHEMGHKLVDYNLLTSYNLWEAIGLEEDLAYSYMGDFNESSKHDEFEVVEGAKEGVTFLKNNFEIMFITARPLYLKDQTTRFISDRLGVESPTIYFSGDDSHHDNNSETKGEICRRLGISYLIEDNVNFFKNSIGNGTKIILLDKPWNRNFDHEEVIRLKNWNEIINFLENKNV